jgi:GH43 family beta-xylosidase
MTMNIEAVVPSFGDLPQGGAQTAKNLEYVTNPVVPQRADPWCYKHTDGFYYFTGSVPAYDLIELLKAPTLQGLAFAEPVVAWRRHERGPMSYHIWAPELHFIKGRWYLYFAAGRAEDIWQIRMYVLENSSPDPTRGEWVEKGQIETAWDSFSLDATSFENSGVRYLVWAQNDPTIENNTNLYIAAMDNPWTIRAPQVRLTKPELDWEVEGFLVNEGPAVLQKNNRIFMTYSASATDHRYCMGLLTADANSDLLDAASWHKSPHCVFRSSTHNAQYGPGHNSFTMSTDGSTDVLVYHARPYRETLGDPLYDPNRNTCMQRIEWQPDGTPVFGVPVALGPHILTADSNCASQEISL